MGGRGSNGNRNSPEDKSIQAYIKSKKKNEILKTSVVSYHGGAAENLTENHALFTTTSRELAKYYAYNGTLQEYTIKKGSKFLIADLNGSNWRKAYKELDGLGDSKLTTAEKEILGKYARDPLRGIAEVARSRGYDGALIKNVVDPKGVNNAKLKGLYLNPVDEYIVTNIKRLHRNN